ncbi:nuclease-related domain-containing protein [Oceanobacillus sp. 1P07AA]|uniref:nuclease-related domain-containing protein n=1 Tax=Oceanobacillus sp. 1P07AA TaxID=3132293 RepID=UPI0039A43E40
MITKRREKTKDLMLYDLLVHRMDFSIKDRQTYEKMKQGYEGERRFDQLFDETNGDSLILQDLLFTHNNTTFQIDSVIITADTIFLLEIKNYKGDFIYENDKLVKMPNTEIIQPLHQLHRSEALFRNMMLGFKYTLPIKSLVIFIHPHFTLYQAPVKIPFVLPTQVQSFVQKLHRNSTMNITERHHLIAKELLNHHISQSKFRNVADYHYDELQKGIYCRNCKQFFDIAYPERKYLVCAHCNEKEDVNTAVLRCVNEYKILFPNEKVTTNNILDWCAIITSKKRIRKILRENYEVKGTKQWTYYI